MTLEKFIQSLFCAKSTQDNGEASCLNIDKEETMKLSPTDNDASKSSPKVSPSGEEKGTGEISLVMSPSSSENSIEPSSEEAHVHDTKITFTNDDLLFG